jgi:hypothetical protein
LHRKIKVSGSSHKKTDERCGNLRQHAVFHNHRNFPRSFRQLSFFRVRARFYDVAFYNGKNCRVGRNASEHARLFRERHRAWTARRLRLSGIINGS